MKNIETNQDRTAEYLKNFNREKTIKLALKQEQIKYNRLFVFCVFVVRIK